MLAMKSYTTQNDEYQFGVDDNFQNDFLTITKTTESGCVDKKSVFFIISKKHRANNCQLRFLYYLIMLPSFSGDSRSRYRPRLIIYSSWIKVPHWQVLDSAVRWRNCIRSAKAACETVGLQCLWRRTVFQLPFRSTKSADTCKCFGVIVLTRIHSSEAAMDRFCCSWNLHIKYFENSERSNAGFKRRQRGNHP